MSIPKYFVLTVFFLISFISCRKNNERNPNESDNSTIIDAKLWFGANVSMSDIRNIGLPRWNAARTEKGRNFEQIVIVPLLPFREEADSKFDVKASTVQTNKRLNNKKFNKKFVYIKNPLTKKVNAFVAEFVIDESEIFSSSLKNFKGVINIFDHHYSFQKGLVADNQKALFPVFHNNSNSPKEEIHSTIPMGSVIYCFRDQYCYSINNGIACVVENRCYEQWASWEYLDYYGGYDYLEQIYGEGQSESDIELQESLDGLQQIVDSLNGYPCAQGVLQYMSDYFGLRPKEMALDVLKGVFYNTQKDDIDVFFRVDESLRGTQTDAYCQMTKFTGTKEAGLFFTFTISVNPSMLETASREYILATFLHEMIHAYIDFNKKILPPEEFRMKFIIYWASSVVGPTDAELFQHNEIAMSYVNQMANLLQAYNPSLTNTVAEALSWGGLHETTVWSRKSDTNDVKSILEIGRRTDTSNYAPLNLIKCF